jgi:glycosyltransferase involved in cell wall biosynthesis
MNKRISVIIFDPLKDQHDYSQIKTNFFDKSELVDESIMLKVVKNTNNILDVLHEHRGFDCIITISDNLDFKPLNDLSFEFRKKWVHINDFNSDVITHLIINVFIGNINRTNQNSEVFSIFTCAYNTPQEYVKRLYESLCNQTYKNWNWWIIDDSSKNKVNYFERIKDPRIHIIKNITEHGNIGFNKHLIAMIADGDYLVEVDHDDELTPDCLELMKRAFDTYEDCDFVYSYALEEIGGRSVWYGDYFALGLGKYEEHEVNGVIHNLPITADVNALSIRHIVAAPNHVRCWKKDFYHKIGGHNTELSVLDDLDILMRTFIHGKMCKIPKVLYIQHEGEDHGDRRSGETTQSKRFNEIRRLGVLLKRKYDYPIHKRLLELGVEDPYWVGPDTEEGYSIIWEGPKENTTILNYTLEL